MASDPTPDGMVQKAEPDPGPGRRHNRRRNAYILTEQDDPLLGQLSERYVEILRQEGSIAEIAGRLGVAPGTVKSRTHRARVALDALRAQARASSRH